MTAPTRVRIDNQHFCEPDVLFVAQCNRHRRQEQFWEKIDLAVEIVSPDDPDRDLIDKRADYATVNIPEYWTIDPRDDTIRVLGLKNGVYRELNNSTCSDIACSIVLDGFQIDVRKLFSAARA